MFLIKRNLNGRSSIRGPRDLSQFGQGTGKNINPNPTRPRQDTFVQSRRDSKKGRDNSQKNNFPIVAPGDPSRGGRISTPTFRINSNDGGNNRTPNPEPLRTNLTGSGASSVTVTRAANQIDTSNLTSSSNPQKLTRNMFLLIGAGIIALFTIN